MINKTKTFSFICFAMRIHIVRYENKISASHCSLNVSIANYSIRFGGIFNFHDIKTTKNDLEHKTAVVIDLDS